MASNKVAVYLAVVFCAVLLGFGLVVFSCTVCKNAANSKCSAEKSQAVATATKKQADILIDLNTKTVAEKRTSLEKYIKN